MHNCPKTLGEHGCAECLRNRSYHKRVWVHRMDLEARLHEKNSFLTLTYSDEFLPANNSLVPDHCVNWLKRFRQAIAPVKVRYFLVGEYGDDSHRPHYHAALFGVGPEYEDVVRETWQMGHVMLGDLNIQSMRYVCGYVTKKMTAKSDERLNGRHPEFTRMSRMPGIGSLYVPNIAAALDCEAGASLVADDVPNALRLHGKAMPLGKYLRSKLKDEIYAKDPSLLLAKLLGSESLYNAIKRTKISDEKMLAMYARYENSSMSEKMSFLDYLKQNRKQKFLNSEAMFNSQQKGSL